MPFRPRRRILYVTLNPLHLTGSIMLGMWLGFMAIAATAWFGYKLVAPMLPPAATAILAPAPAAPPVVQTPDGSTAMFEQYQQNLQKQQLRDAEESARTNPRNLNNPQCQFWLQQNQTAPSDKSRNNVLQFCD